MPAMFKKGQGKYGHTDCGKGLARRPKQISDEELEKRWENIFGKDVYEVSRKS